ncbi:DP1 DNA-binding protein [Sesbania bispinosa]|nr:DP1 DNA-binding protein [Sesbania bispinosa]
MASPITPSRCGIMGRKKTSHSSAFTLNSKFNIAPHIDVVNNSGIKGSLKRVLLTTSSSLYLWIGD